VESITYMAAGACAALTYTAVLTRVSFAGVRGGGRVNVITDTLTLVRSVGAVEPIAIDLLREQAAVEAFGEPVEEPDWQERALCAQTDPEAFFPEKGGSTREAKRICSGCEVRAECLEYALANDERFGIWGGLSERERRRLRRAVV
jgi:WhiB family transcriptional regulator, redox-sensing transcriptional regulator